MEINGYELVLTCGACPEQYDVFKDGEEVGYLRLRHGRFRVEVTFGGDVVYEASPEGDGIFDYDERDYYLTKAVEAINHKLEQAINLPCSEGELNEH